MSCVATRTHKIDAIENNSGTVKEPCH